LLPPFAAQCDPAPSNVREGVNVTVGVNVIVGVSAFCMLMDEETTMNPIIVMRQVINAVAFVS